MVNRLSFQEFSLPNLVTKVVYYIPFGNFNDNTKQQLKMKNQLTHSNKIHLKEFLTPKELSLKSLVGKLKQSPNFSGDPITLQRKLRDEWEREKKQ